MKKYLSLMFVCLLTGCSTLGIAPFEERKFPTILNDSSIKIGILNKWRHTDENIYPNLELLVHEGRVLIIGRLPETKQQIEAIRLAWEDNGVKEVIDEIVTGPESTLSEFTKDSFITAQMKTALTLNKHVNSLNYDYKTYGGVLYIIGRAQTEIEKQHVLDTARSLKGVKEIVSHILVKDSPTSDQESISTSRSTETRSSIVPRPGDIKQY